MSEIEEIIGNEPLREGEYPLYYKVGVDGVTRIDQGVSNPEPYCERFYYQIFKGSHLHCTMTCNLDAARLRHKYGGRLESGDSVVLRWAGFRRDDARRIERGRVEQHRPALNKTAWG